MDEGLKSLFQAGLELSLQVQADAMAAEPDQRARLALTFHRLSRGVRQTAALRMRIAREAERGGREASAEVIDLAKRRLEKRKGQVKAAVEGLIWTEAESEETRTVLDYDLDELITLEAQDPETFEAEDLDEQVERFAAKLGLSFPAAATPTVIPRSGDKPDPGVPSGLANRPSQLGSPASPCGRAEDDGGNRDPYRSSA
ncbi:hypothetical protein [Phenylobacterium sp.]|uniref:hypothetical protein n=1 Tax=Phenylobacterium sp. TaxID=1871053 RepID=UPI002DF05AE7|nr:hypothetical protein [Phenylobacterium sp.]